MASRRRNGRRSQRRLGRQYHTSTESLSLSTVSAFESVRVSRLVAVVLIMLLGWVIYSVFNSPTFYVYGVEVSGNAAVAPEEVYAASGLEGMSIFWVDKDAISDQIEALPNVKSARVRVRLPASVTVLLEERAPSLVWRSGDSHWWIDAGGTVVPPLADLDDVLTVVDTDGRSIVEGDHLDASVLAAVREMHHFLPELSVMYYSDTTGIGFKTSEGWPVYLGDARDMEFKLTVLVPLRKYLLDQGITPEFVNVQFPERPFYK